MPDTLTLFLLAIAWAFSGMVVGIAWGRRHAAKVETRLQSIEARSHAVLDAAVDGVVTIDEAGAIHGFNRAAERIFGYAAPEVMGQNVSMLMPEPYRGEHDSYIHNYLTTGIPRVIGHGRQVEGLRRDGTSFPMELAVGESRLGGRRIFAGIVRDITERKAVEEKLRTSEERVRILVEGVRDYAIVMLDPDGLIVSWNKGAERLFGWTADEVAGSPIARFQPLDGSADAGAASSLRVAERDGRCENEGWRLRKSGSRFWAHTITTVLRDAHGRTRGFACISKDITQEKAQGEALQAAKDEAERARNLAEAARETAEAARLEAERANAAKTRFLAAASHDLRQPVQAIFFFTSVLADKLSGQPTAKVVDDLETSVEGLNMLLDSLLDVSKLDAGLITPKETAFSIASILDRSAAEFRQPARARNLTLTVMPCSATVRSDPALLSRIVQNLISNAIRYTAKGRILVGCRRTGDKLRVEVWDTGMGIPAERTREIFEEFTQLANPERDRTQGLGLGLAIVRRLARLLGHGVGVRSTPGKGSVFSVIIPMVTAEHAPRRGAASSGNGRLVVLIDDEPIVLKGLALVLESWGYQVVAAASDDEAIALLDGLGQQPALILADYRLREGHTGTQAVARLRGRFNASIPSIIITGDTAPERLREAQSSGLAILHKPIQPPALRDAVRETLSGSSTLH